MSVLSTTHVSTEVLLCRVAECVRSFSHPTLALKECSGGACAGQDEESVDWGGGLGWGSHVMGCGKTGGEINHQTFRF